MATLAIDARSWKSAEWAANHGLYAEVFDSADAMDVAVDRLESTGASTLCTLTGLLEASQIR